MKLTLAQIAGWIGAEGEFTAPAQAVGYSIDSRTISEGELFFAVRGERLDGHDYVKSALTNGAIAAVVGSNWPAPAGVDSSRLLRVRPDGEDAVLAALQRLANTVRRTWGGLVIGVTGSAGKTTTKEAVAQVLSAKFRVLKSHGNLNNAFGLPLQLLKLEPEHEIAVIEMGMNHAGEITALAHIAEPNWAVVSNVAPVHLEHFPEGIEGIARAKYELIEALPPDGIAILNCDDERVAKFGAGMGERAVFYGTAECAQVRAANITELGIEGTVFNVTAASERAAVHLHLLGRHNVSNALAAIAAGIKSGISLEECATCLAELSPSDKRGEIFEWRGARLINDCYNSNPRALDSMVDALLSMLAGSDGRHIVVAGEMLELGPDGAALHSACGGRMAERGVDVVIGVRGLAASLVDAAKAAGAQGLFVPSPEDAGDWLKRNLRPGDTVLLKASRGVKLERALASLVD